MGPVQRAAVLFSGRAPVLTDYATTFGKLSPNFSDAAQTDLAATFRAAGAVIGFGRQEWRVVNAGTTGGSLTDFRYNSSTNPLTASGYLGTGNTGRTPYRSATLTGTVYWWEYQVRVNGGPWSNVGRLTYNIDATGCSIGNNYVSGHNYPGVVVNAADGAAAYTAGIRTLYIMTGVSRRDLRMGSGFNFASGTGWSTSAMMVLKWADNQRPANFSAMSWSSSGLWIDLEYDGVTVTGGRFYGNNQSVTAKIQISGDSNRVTRCNLMNTEGDFEIEHTGVAVNTWGGIQVNGNNNEIGYAPGGATDYSYANYITHCFYGIYVPTGSGNSVTANVVAHCHGRSIGRGFDTSDNVVRYNIVGQTWRTRYPSNDTSNHLDHIWSNDNNGTTPSNGTLVEQNPTIENNLIYPFGGRSSSARQIVLGATGLVLDIATPTVRGNIIIGPYTYGTELGRWSGSGRFTHNTMILSLVGDYTDDIALGYPPDNGNAAMRLLVKPVTLVAAATLESDKNYLWNTRDIGDGAGGYADTLAVTTGTDVENARSASPTGFPGGTNPQTVFAAAATSTWDTPTNATMVSTLLNYVWAALARASDGAVNSGGTGWATLP